MKPAPLCMLSFFLLSPLLHGRADADEPRATLTAENSIIPAGGSVTLSCSVDGSTDWEFEWFRNGRHYPESSGNTEPNGTIRVSEGGKYRCRGKRRDSSFYSDSEEVTIQETEIKATLKADKTTIPPGGSVTLTCSVDKPAGLTFELLREPSFTYQTRVSPTSDGVFRITEGGIYTCRGYKPGTNFVTTTSNEVTINKTVSNRVSVTSQPNWSQIYRDERITLRCEIQGGTDWMYEWRPTNGNSPSSSEYISITSTESDSGDYSCMGRRGYEFTGWSEAFRLTVSSDEPRATLTAENRIIPAGGSVTLSCSVDGSTDWEFEWFRNGRHYPESSGNTEPDGTIRVSEGGKYSCRGKRRDSSFYSDSEEVTIQETGSKPTVILNPSSSLTEDKIHLECFMQKGPEWTYEWRKNNLDYNPTSRIITAESGDYSCRGKSDNVLIQWSDVITLTISPNKPSLILQPNWSQIYRGEEITLRCEIHGGTEYDWTYEWRPTNRNSPTSSEYMRITATDNGDYSCRGIRGGFSLTSWSNVIKITVSSRPQPVLSVSPSWPNPGASVTLSCEGLKLQSAGWRFFWYKAVPDPSKLNYGPSYTYELLPDSITGTEQNSFIINGPTQTAGYQCRAGRGEPKFYTRYSEVKFIWSADPGPAASLSVNPDRVQHFRSDSVSLSCEGNSAEWRVRRFTETGQLSYFTCSYWGTMTGSTCTFKPYHDKNGVYWCESKSGEFSNAVNITEQNDYYNGIILVSPVHPVTEGDPVTLSCRNKQQFLSNVFFYHNDKLINNDGRDELNISAVSKSDEGFYKCKHSGKESPRSWMSVRVTVTSSVSSSFPVLLIVGSVVGIVLIILIIVLILLWRCRRSRGLCCISPKGSEVRGQSSTTNQPGGHEYGSLPPENAYLYDTIGSAEAAGNAADERPEVTYSLLEMKSCGKEKRRGGPEEGAVYSEVKTGAAGSTETYAVIDHQKEVKKKAKIKGKSGPAAAEAAVYSEIRSAPALENSAAM